METIRRIPRKVRVPLKLHRQDLTRIDGLLSDRETRTAFIEEAITLLFERREGGYAPRRGMQPLV
jgi:hypothetical protein